MQFATACPLISLAQIRVILNSSSVNQGASRSHEEGILTHQRSYQELAILLVMLVLPLSAEAQKPSSGQAQELVERGRCPTVHVRSLEDDAWLPRGNVTDESKRGNTHTIEVWWSAPDPDLKKGERELAPREIRVALTPTAHRGVCGNFGANGLPDFRILAGDGNLGRWKIGDTGFARTKLKLRRGQQVRLVLSSFDFAGAVLVTATIPLLAGEEHCKDLLPKGQDEPEAKIGLPIDKDGDHLPDSWERGHRDRFKVDDDLPADKRQADAHLDDESAFGDAVKFEPKAGVTGDGLTAWEEYRGFRVNGTHHRLDPAVKDLFVFVNDALKKTGVGYLSKLSGVKVHRVRIERDEAKTEMETDEEGGGSERINRNNAKAAFAFPVGWSRAQHGLTIILRNARVEGPKGGRIMGRMFPEGVDEKNLREMINTGPDGVLQSIRKDPDEAVPGMALNQGLPHAVIGVWQIPAKDGEAAALERDLKAAVTAPDRLTSEGGFFILRTGPRGVRATPGMDATLERQTTIPYAQGAPRAEAIRPAKDKALASKPLGDDLRREFVGAPVVPGQADKIEVYLMSIDDVTERILKLTTANQRQSKSEEQLNDKLRAYVVAHEAGHGMHVEHYHTLTRSPGNRTVMASGGFWMLQGYDPPQIWLEVDKRQIRLHAKHE